MKKKMLLTVILVALSSSVYAGFLITESSQPKVPTVERDQSIHDNYQLHRKPLFRSARVATEQSDQIGSIRTFVKHQGRKPAVFGKAVNAPSDVSLSEIVANVMPDTFQAFSADTVDMNVVVKGGKSSNWVSSLTNALRDTPYTATINWDKHEVFFDVDAQGGGVDSVAKVEKPLKTWDVKISDGLLSQVIDKWCSEAGSGECARFVNQANRDLVIEGEMTVSGDFRSAISQLMAAVSDQVGGVFRWRIAPNKVLILSDDVVEK